MRKIVLFSILVMFLMIVAGCGNKKPPVPPSELFGVSVSQ